MSSEVAEISGLISVDDLSGGGGEEGRGGDARGLA